MYGVTMAHAWSLKPASKWRTVQVFTTMGITSILSWPFASALASVLVINDLVQANWNRVKIRELSLGVFQAVVIVFLILVRLQLGEILTSQ
jgi:hypothetical protein